MPEQFEDRDLSDSVFWGVQLQRALVRDANLTGARFFHTFWSDVSIDGVIDRLVVNGVDVTEFVNAHDRWFPLRTQLEPDTADALRSTWAVLQAEWATLLARASLLPSEAVLASVNGEWCLRDTLRHLLFAMDKWFCLPVLGALTYTSIGLPNTGSQGLDWPGLNASADPTFDDVLATRRQQHERFDDFAWCSARRFDDLREMVVEFEVARDDGVETERRHVGVDRCDRAVQHPTRVVVGRGVGDSRCTGVLVDTVAPEPLQEPMGTHDVARVPRP